MDYLINSGIILISIIYILLFVILVFFNIFGGEIMLSKPEYGWCDISICDWKDRASYLTDPHLDLLDAFIGLFKSRKSQVVDCDAEGWEYKIVIDFFEVHIIESKEGYKYYSFDIGAGYLASELIKDIEKNIEEWSKWDYCGDSEEDYLSAKKRLKYKINLLKKFLKNS